MPWRTKVSGARPVEHVTCGEADALVAELRQRYQAGSRTVRVVRVYDPEGGVRVIDFASEAREAARVLGDLRRATASRERAVREVTEGWEQAVARAVELGQDPAAVAEAAGATVREIRAIVRRKSRDA